MGSVYKLTLGQLAGRWRLLIMAVLAVMPLMMTLLVVGDDSPPQVGEFEIVVISTMLAGGITPLVVLAIAAAALGNEVEDRTLANLTLAPIPRWQIALPKLLAVITIAAPFIAASAFLTAHMAFLGDLRAATVVAGGAVLAVTLYSSVFVWLGLVARQAIGLGLLYVVLWEGFFAGFVSGARLLSIRHYAIGVMHGLDARRFAEGTHLGMEALIPVSAVIIGGFLLLTVRRLKSMDVA